MAATFQFLAVFLVMTCKWNIIFFEPFYNYLVIAGKANMNI
jgi:hypothetical protein